MNKQHTIDSGLEKKDHVNSMRDWLKTCRTPNKTSIIPVLGTPSSGTYKNNTFIPYIDISSIKESK